MRLNPVKQALLAGKTVLGTSYGQLRDPEIARILKAAGFDYAYLDGEHGCFGIETQQDICRVAGLCGLTIFARVADIQYDLIARSLDCGADGIIFPRGSALRSEVNVALLRMREDGSYQRIYDRWFASR
jgi:2-keto-3-deoxy-L-rhamnonate aldolase RhmA